MSTHAAYRLRVAQGFLEEAEQDFQFQRWRACISHAQLAVENALKAVIALFTVPPKTHNPAHILATLLQQGQIPQKWREPVEDLIQKSQTLGPEVHIQTDYGDELHGLTPWELFSEEDAREALEVAHRVVHMARQLVEAVQEDNDEA
ncbi:HEPN domain-containing protein [Thermodesulfatator autotrophicus]|uniref:HEPN domain-containing protein n=1 Tax=Thermodesulfatator autotrophicus TaxID=1795632 RepID=A0A177EBJ8_9BACT|nr:HEPN domain-containing protein [Thermodesulfatator autotrophicus]OAG28552.1 hypothetical protein TH606_00935 [Thermodesulfatator autotrophicus]